VDVIVFEGEDLRGVLEDNLRELAVLGEDHKPVREREIGKP